MRRNGCGESGAYRMVAVYRMVTSITSYTVVRSFGVGACTWHVGVVITKAVVLPAMPRVFCAGRAYGTPLQYCFPCNAHLVLPAVTNERQMSPPRHVLQSLPSVNVPLLVVHGASSESLVPQRLANLQHLCQLVSFGKVTKGIMVGKCVQGFRRGCHMTNDWLTTDNSVGESWHQDVCFPLEIFRQHEIKLQGAYSPQYHVQHFPRYHNINPTVWRQSPKQGTTQLLQAQYNPRRRDSCKGSRATKPINRSLVP